MSLAIAIVSLLAALVPFAIWLIKKYYANHEDPLEQNRRRYEQAEADVAARDSAGATLHGGDDLAELDRLRHARDQRRGTGNLSESEPKL